jgi:hypothetical protein
MGALKTINKIRQTAMLPTIMTSRFGPKRPYRTVRWLLVLAALHIAGCASPPVISDASRRPQKAITDFGTVETPETLTVLVKSDQPLTYTASRQEDPRGVSFRFPDTRLDGLHTAYFPPANSLIRSIRSVQDLNTMEARVFLELLREEPFEATPDEEGLKIVFRLAPASPAAEKMAAPSSQPTRPAETASAPPAVDGTLLREVRTEVRVDGVVIRVKANGSVKTARVITLENPARIVFDLVGLQSAFHGEQRLPVRSEWVSQVRHHGYPDKVRLVADTDTRYLKSYFWTPTTEGLEITIGNRQP